MISESDARELVCRFITCHPVELSVGDELIILDHLTIERPWGWVFFYTSKKWFETNDMRYALGGNGPIFVSRNDASVHPMGTAYATDHYIKKYEAELERQAGTWVLIISDSPTTPKLSAIRRALGLGLTEIAALRPFLPGPIRHGARIDLDPLRENLLKAGISAKVCLVSDVLG